MTSADSPAPLVSVAGLSVRFASKSGSAGKWIQAVDDVSLNINAGESVGLVGESGSGKTSLGRAILRLNEWSDGSVRFDKTELGDLGTRELRALRRRMQIILQDPRSSLNPRMRVSKILSEPLTIHGIGKRSEHTDRVDDLLRLVSLDPGQRDRFPHEFSGGQLQRIGIAQALAVEPDFLVLDEPVSALDVSVQAQIINLLIDLRERLNLTYLFIGHDLDVVRRLCTRVFVMYLGTIVEGGPIEEVYENPRHPYTKALLSASPKPDPHIERTRQRILIQGDLPSAGNIPSGCRFHGACWLYEQLGRPEKCRSERPTIASTEPAHAAACHFSDQVSSRAGGTQGRVGQEVAQ